MGEPAVRRLVAVPRFVSLLLIALLTLSAVVGAAVRPLPALARDGSTFVQLANEKRASVGKGPVGFSSLVDQIAVERGNQMANANKLEHDMAYIDRRLKELGACYSSYGEIIYWEKGYASFSVQRAIDAWWKSTGHHAIMVGDFNAAGGSWSEASDGGRYAVMIFVKLCTAPTSSNSNVTRVAGGDRYATAAAVSKITYGSGVPVVFIATGEKFPDALSASAAAARLGGPVLLVTRTTVPAVTATELGRLKPQRIVVVGSNLTVSDGIADALRQYTSGPVERVAGPDRYATAAAVSARTFGPGVEVAYVSTGEKFPDALAGGAAAGKDRGPVLLVRGDTIPTVAAAELKRLKPGRIVVLGSSVTVSEAVAQQLWQYAATVTRVAGSDRYATSVAVSKSGYGSGSATTIFIATGQNFPDGLAGGPAAAGVPGPLLLVRSDALPSVVASEISRLDPDRVVILGGTPSVSSSVANAIDAIVD